MCIYKYNICVYIYIYTHSNWEHVALPICTVLPASSEFEALLEGSLLDLARNGEVISS